jgi:hypothetical protein
MKVEIEITKHQMERIEEMSKESGLPVDYYIPVMFEYGLGISSRLHEDAKQEFYQEYGFPK